MDDDTYNARLREVTDEFAAEILCDAERLKRLHHDWEWVGNAWPAMASLFRRLAAGTGYLECKQLDERDAVCCAEAWRLYNVALLKARREVAEEARRRVETEMLYADQD